MTGWSWRQAGSWAGGLLIGLAIGLLTIGGPGGVAFGIGIGLAFGIALTRTASRTNGATSEPDAHRRPRETSGEPGQEAGPAAHRDVDLEDGRP